MDSIQHSSPSSSPLLDAALDYVARGYAIIPCEPHSKRPLAAAAPRGKDSASREPRQIKAWWTRYPNANIAIVCDASGIVVLDADSPEASAACAAWLGRDPTVVTARGGHFYCRRVNSAAPRNGRVRIPGTDYHVEVKALGYVIAPPSVHPSGWQYTCPDDELPPVADLPEPPAGLPATIAAQAGIARAEQAGRAERIPAGARNQTLASIAGRLRRIGHSQTEIEALLLATNRERCEPPLPDDEVRGIARSIGRYAPAEPVTAAAAPRDTTADRDPGEYPLDAWPAEIAEWIHAAAESVGLPPEAAGLFELPVLARAIGRSFYARGPRPGWIERPIFWTCLIGRSGSRKSPMLDLITRALADRERAAQERYRSEMQEYEARRAVWSTLPREERERLASAPPTLRGGYYVTESTFEGLAARLETCRDGVLLCAGELARWLGGFDAYSNGRHDRGRWLDLWSGSPLAVYRRGSPGFYAPNPHVQILTTTQPRELPRLLRQSDDGLAQRFLFVSLPDDAFDYGADVEIPRWDEIAAARVAAIDRLFALPRPELGEKPWAITLTPEAAEAHREFRREIGEQQATLDEDLTIECGAVAKYAGYALRIALVLALLAGEREAISADAMRRALLLARWHMRTTRRIIAEVLGEDEFAAALAAARRVLPRRGVLTRNEYSRAMQRHRAMAGRVLDHLVQQGEIERVREGRAEILRVIIRR